MQKYVQLILKPEHLDSGITDIIVALLNSYGFESFLCSRNEVSAYISKDSFDKSLIETIGELPVFQGNKLNITTDIIEKQNWNKVWERDYKPIVIPGICAILAPFHPVISEPYILKIEPKMSFGTGHHETTRLMIRQIFSSDMKNKTVLDMGCGTGVLGIFSVLRKAKYITGIDIDEWAVKNSIENFERNNIQADYYSIIAGDASVIPGKKFDIVLANINKNIILTNLQEYIYHLSESGLLIISGVLSKDRDEIMEKASSLGITFISELYENSWISLKFRKYF